MANKPARAKGGAAVVNPGLPHVNLLPATVVEARALKGLKRLLALVLLAVIVAIGAVTAWAYMDASAAADEKTEEQNRTTALLTEQAKYAEAPALAKKVTDTQTALVMASATDIRWAPYLNAISAVTPEGVTIQSFTVENLSPTAGMPGVKDPLGSPIGVGRITMSAIAPDRNVIADWSDALAAVPGFADARVNTTAITGGADGAEVGYTVAIDLSVLPSAYSFPFVAEVNE